MSAAEGNAELIANLIRRSPNEIFRAKPEPHPDGVCASSESGRRRSSKQDRLAHKFSRLPRWLRHFATLRRQNAGIQVRFPLQICPPSSVVSASPPSCLAVSQVRAARLKDFLFHRNG